MHQSRPLLLLLLLIAPWAVLCQSQQPMTDTKHHSLLEIPSIGLGLWNSKADDATHAVESAFKTGYHHLDSAAAYSNEEYVGAAISESSSPKRHNYWITSKLWNTMHKPTNVPKALNKTLSDLKTPYLDLWLMHWPVAFLPDQSPGRTIIDQNTNIEETWRAMEELVSKDPMNPDPGTARYIGVSNFSPRQLDQILKMCTVCPYAHEFETHPYLQQQDFVGWHAKHGIKVIAYSPFGNLNPTYSGKYPDLPSILDDRFWVEMAEKKNVTVAQAVLGWGIARDTIVIPKSVKENHIKENFGGRKVEFTEKEMEEVAERDKKARFNNPSKDWGVDLFEGLDDGSNRFL